MLYFDKLNYEEVHYMNRQNRRHPTHPVLPVLYPSKKRIVDSPCKKASTASKRKRHHSRRKGS